MPERTTLHHLLAAALVCVAVSARAQGTGSISGQILDSSNGRPVMGANVLVLDTEVPAAATDSDGRFGIRDVPPGEYSVRITAPRYGSALVEKVLVEDGKEASVRSGLTPQADAGIEVVEVVADVTESSEATQLLKRKMAPTVSDNLGAESISKTPDSDAAEVVTRIPSVTIKDGSFIVVRGLGDRYNSALMNGGRLPSPDPTRRVVPLDLFPADFIESITLVKSYTPDLPGDFAGGLVDLRITDPPLERVASIGLSTGLNTESTFQDFDTYPGCGTADWFGFGDNCRNRPGSFPSRDELTRINSTGSVLQRRAVASSLPQNWDLHSTTAPPNFSGDVQFGDTWGDLGINFATTYGTKHKVRRGETVGTLKSDSPEGQFQFLYDRSTFETTLGSILTATYRISPQHRLGARVLYNRASEDEVLNGIEPGRDENQGLLLPYNSVYIADQLAFLQMSSQHDFGFVDVDLLASVGNTTRDQPDGKTVVRHDVEADGVSTLLIGTASSGQRYFADLDETLQEYKADFSVPFDTSFALGDTTLGGNSIVKLGAAHMYRDRDFKLLILTNRVAGGDAILGNIDLATATADDLFQPLNYGPGGLALIPIPGAENERFQSSQTVSAGYAMADIPILADKLRLIAGARLEYSYIFVVGALPAGPVRQPINDLDVIPAASLVYSLTDKTNLRFAYSRTVSRPEFRELNPAIIPTSPGQREFRGNIGLTSAKIQNFDLRWEWFVGPLELLSFGMFYKDLSNPIELSAVPGASGVIETRTNAEEAIAWGAEFEARKNFNFLVPYARRWKALGGAAYALADIELVFNGTLVESEVSGLRPVPGFPELLVTNENRALTDQAPFVINTALQYEHFDWGTFRLLYNTVGETIVAAGTRSQDSVLDDIKQQRRDQVDFVWLRNWSPYGQSIKTKLSVENITNDDHLETQRIISANQDFVSSHYFTGVTFNLGMTYSF
jgi:hypothetical protein